MVFDFDLLFVVQRLYTCLPYQEFYLRLTFKFINFYRCDFYRCKPRLHVIYELTKDCLVADYIHFANPYILSLMLPTIY